FYHATIMHLCSGESMPALETDRLLLRDFDPLDWEAIDKVRACSILVSSPNTGRSPTFRLARPFRPIQRGGLFRSMRRKERLSPRLMTSRPRLTSLPKRMPFLTFSWHRPFHISLCC